MGSGEQEKSLYFYPIDNDNLQTEIENIITFLREKQLQIVSYGNSDVVIENADQLINYHENDTFRNIEKEKPNLSKHKGVLIIPARGIARGENVSIAITYNLNQIAGINSTLRADLVKVISQLDEIKIPSK